MKPGSFVLAVTLAVLALPAAAQDVAGKWMGSVDTQGVPFELAFQFAVNGNELSGSMSNDFIGMIPITEGMISGAEVSFKLSIDGGPGGAMVISYKGMIEGDELKLTSTFEGGAAPGGGPAEQSFTLTRAE